MSDLQKLKVDLLPEGRIETGPLQVNDDWPGVFIRGDNALGYAIHLEQLLANAEGDAFSQLWCKNLLALLRSSNAANFRDK